MDLNPTTVAPLASFTASGRARRKTASRFYFREVGASGLGTLALSFTTGGSGHFNRTLTAPDGPDRSVEVILRQRRSDGVWAQVASAKLLLVTGGGGGTTPIPNPPPTPPPDITAPVITSGPTVSAITTTSAQVSWTLGEAGTGQVEYGTTSAHGSTTTLEAGYLTSHSQTISGLTPGQTYHYRVLSRDAAGNLVQSSNRTFTTTAAATLPGAPTGLVATGGNTQISLAWTAPANNGGSAITGYRVYRNGASLVVLGNVTSYTNTGLANGVTHSYSVAAITAIGEGPQSNTASATTNAGGDINPPVISNVTVTNITQTSATVSWSTNEAATGIVDYGLTPAYGSSTAPTSSGTAHSRNLTGLSAGQTYHIRIRATDTAGNTAQDTGRSFTTLDSSPATCTTTVAAGGNIQAAIDAAGAGATICLTPGATYTLTTSLAITNKTGLTLDGKGATIRTNLAPGATFPSGAAEIIRAVGGSNLTFRNLTIIGSHSNPGFYPPPTTEFQAGIAFVGTQTALVEYVTVRNNMGDGVGAYANGSTPMRNLTVRYCDFGGQGRWGVTFTHAEVGWVHHNVFANLPIAFETEGDTGDHITNVIFEDNTLSGRLNNLFAAYGPGTITDVIVRRNTVAAGANLGIRSYIQPTAGFRAVRFRFENNTGSSAISEDPRTIIQLCNSDNATVTGNTQPVASGSGMVGVSQFNCTGTTVSGNSFPNTIATTATWGTCNG